MLLGMADSSEEATKMVMIGQKERPPPQLYTGNDICFYIYFLKQFIAPDPDEDPEAQKAMENLATLAAQVFTVISSGIFVVCIFVCLTVTV
jgi:hypothetical protein